MHGPWLTPRSAQPPTQIYDRVYPCIYTQIIINIICIYSLIYMYLLILELILLAYMTCNGPFFLNERFLLCIWRLQGVACHMDAGLYSPVQLARTVHLERD